MVSPGSRSQRVSNGPDSYRDVFGLPHGAGAATKRLVWKALEGKKVNSIKFVSAFLCDEKK